MKPEMLQDAIGEIDELYIAEAHAPIRRKVRRRSVFLLAACLAALVLLAGLWLASSRHSGNPALPKTGKETEQIQAPIPTQPKDCPETNPESPLPELLRLKRVLSSAKYYQVSNERGTDLHFGVSDSDPLYHLSYGTDLFYCSLTRDGLIKIRVLSGAQSELTGYVNPNDLSFLTNSEVRNLIPACGNRNQMGSGT